MQAKKLKLLGAVINKRASRIWQEGTVISRGKSLYFDGVLEFPQWDSLIIFKTKTLYHRVILSSFE